MIQKAISFIFCFFALQTYAAEAPYGIFITVQGEVTVISAQNQSTPAKVGGKIISGDSITTGADSGAKIVMSDKNIIHLASDSILKIEKYENDAATGLKNVSLNLGQGNLRTDVEEKYDGDKNQFLVKTPTSVSGVRGTQFITSYDPATSTSEVMTIRGAVSYASLDVHGRSMGAPVMVREGHTTSARRGMMPRPPRPMHPDEIRKHHMHFVFSNMKKQHPKSPEQTHPKLKPQSQIQPKPKHRR